jgi:hypothetical protein
MKEGNAALREEIKTGNAELRSEIATLSAAFAALNRTLIQVGFGIATAIVAAILLQLF